MIDTFSVFVFLAESFVFSLIHKLIEFLLRWHLHLQDPSVFLSRIVYQCGVDFNIFIVGGDLPLDRRVDVCCSLNALNATNTIAFGEDSSNICEVQVDNVSQFALSELGNADLCFLKKSSLFIIITFVSVLNSIHSWSGVYLLSIELFLYSLTE